MENKGKSLVVVFLFCTCFLFGQQEPSTKKTFEGKYYASELRNNTPTANRNNFIQLLNRKLIRDTLWTNNYTIDSYRFSIKQVGRRIEIGIEDAFGVRIAHRKYKYSQKDSVITLRNQNVKFLLLPYIAGALDITRIKIYTNSVRELTIECFKHRSGGFFLIPMGWSNDRKEIKYKRVE